jgi:hypothetical protein
MSAHNSYLVDYELGVVGPECEIYPADGRRAEPSAAHAAALMRRVCGKPKRARRIAERARADIAQALAPGRQARRCAAARRDSGARWHRGEVGRTPTPLGFGAVQRNFPALGVSDRIVIIGVATSGLRRRPHQRMLIPGDLAIRNDATPAAGAGVGVRVSGMRAPSVSRKSRNPALR